MGQMGSSAEETLPTTLPPNPAFPHIGDLSSLAMQCRTQGHPRGQGADVCLQVHRAVVQESAKECTQDKGSNPHSIPIHDIRLDTLRLPASPKPPMSLTPGAGAIFCGSLHPSPRLSPNSSMKRIDCLADPPR